MIPKDINEITELDLQALIANVVSEGKTIEYKQVLQLGPDNEKKEFLADVSSFANASGGDLIIGIQERDGNPINVIGIDIDDGGLLRLDSIIREGIEPRLPSVHIQPIRLATSKTVLLIRIAKSWISPHRVIFQKHDKFYSRSSNGKYPLDVNELRVAFNFSETINERVKTFKSDRIANIYADETPMPLQDSARIVLHLIPYNAFIPGQKYNIERNDLLRQLVPMGAREWNGKYNFDGFITYTGVPELKHRSYTQLYRNGIIEAVESSFLKVRTAGELNLPIGYCEQTLIGTLNGYLNFLKSLGVELPVVGFLTLIKVKGYGMIFGPGVVVWERIVIDRDILNLPEFIINDYGIRPDHLLRPCFDAIWNACGCPKSEHYDANGNWQAPR